MNISIEEWFERLNSLGKVAEMSEVSVLAFTLSISDYERDKRRRKRIIRRISRKLERLWKETMGDSNG